MKLYVVCIGIYDDFSSICTYIYTSVVRPSSFPSVHGDRLIDHIQSIIYFIILHSDCITIL